MIELGPVTLREYNAWLIAGALLALAMIAWRAARHGPQAVTRWLDAGIAAIVGGVIGGRLLYAVLEWDTFEQPGEIARLSLGGMAWHGALLLGLLAALLIARWRGVPLRPWTDAAALAFPVGVSAAWLACRRAGCGYGYEVRTLADWPGWLVEELPDVYGLIAPRLDVQLGGALWGLVLLVLAAVLTWRGWLPGLRLWLILAWSGVGFALLGFFRADPAQTIAGRRVDQLLDLLVLLLSTLAGCLIWLRQRRRIDRAHTQKGETADESEAGPGPDRAETGRSAG